FRSNYALREYEEALGTQLRPFGITVRQEGGGLFYQRPEVVATFRVLRLLLHYPDDTTLSLALRTPYLSDVQAAQEEQRLLQYGVKCSRPLTDWFEQTYPQAAARLEELRGMVRSATVPQILARLYELFDVRRVYLGQGDRQAAENLEKLREVA